MKYLVSCIFCMFISMASATEYYSVAQGDSAAASPFFEATKSELSIQLAGNSYSYCNDRCEPRFRSCLDYSSESEWGRCEAKYYRCLENCATE